MITDADIAFVFLFRPQRVRAVAYCNISSQCEDPGKAKSLPIQDPAGPGGGVRPALPFLHTLSVLMLKRPRWGIEKWDFASCVRAPEVERVDTDNAVSMSASHNRRCNVGPLPSASKSVSNRYWWRGRIDSGSIVEYSFSASHRPTRHGYDRREEWLVS